MKISSIQMPQLPFKIMDADAGCIAEIFDNVTNHTENDSMTGQEVTVWDYEKYSIPAAYTVNLAADIESNFAAWLQKAKDYEFDIEAAKIRAYRDKLLNDCDTLYCNAANWALKDDTEKAQWQAYKQALRDVPTQSGFPYTVTFPAIPKTETVE